MKEKGIFRSVVVKKGVETLGVALSANGLWSILGVNASRTLVPIDTIVLINNYFQEGLDSPKEPIRLEEGYSLTFTISINL
jgi:hypothetical protein